MMEGIDRYSPYETLSEYEKELGDVAPVPSEPPHHQKTDYQASGIFGKQVSS